MHVTGTELLRPQRGKSSDAKAIIESSQAKRIEMHFVHDVTTKELQDGWSEAFESNHPNLSSIEGEISKFNASMRNVKSGDSIVLEFYGIRSMS